MNTLAVVLGVVGAFKFFAGHNAAIIGVGLLLVTVVVPVLAAVVLWLWWRFKLLVNWVRGYLKDAS